jgi:hypothetical protein
MNIAPITRAGPGRRRLKRRGRNAHGGAAASSRSTRHTQGRTGGPMGSHVFSLAEAAVDIRLALRGRPHRGDRITSRKRPTMDAPPQGCGRKRRHRRGSHARGDLSPLTAMAARRLHPGGAGAPLKGRP